ASAGATATPTISSSSKSARTRHAHSWAEIAQHAHGAPRTLRDADLAAVPDQIHVQRIHLGIGNALLERRLRRDGIGPWRHEAKPDRDTVNVRIDRKERTIEREEEHARGGLRPYAGQRDQRVPELGVRHGHERAFIERHTALPYTAQ